MVPDRFDSLNPEALFLLIYNMVECIKRAT